MKAVFEKLKTISDEYRNTVDDLSENYELDGRRDFQFNDEVKTQRLQERNTDFNNRIDLAAAKAVQDAAPLIDKLREAVRAYVTDTKDTAKVQTIQALLSAGVQLTDVEITAFADGAGYAVLRLLERPSKGHIQAPKPEGMEADLQELSRHFKDIVAYRGKLAPIGAGGYWGRSSVVGSTIMKSQLDRFAEKADTIATRWACVFGGGAR